MAKLLRKAKLQSILKLDTWEEMPKKNIHQWASWRCREVLWWPLRNWDLRLWHSSWAPWFPPGEDAKPRRYTLKAPWLLPCWAPKNFSVNLACGEKCCKPCLQNCSSQSMEHSGNTVVVVHPLGICGVLETHGPWSTSSTFFQAQTCSVSSELE